MIREMRSRWLVLQRCGPPRIAGRLKVHVRAIVAAVSGAEVGEGVKEGWVVGPQRLQGVGNLHRHLLRQ